MANLSQRPHPQTACPAGAIRHRLGQQPRWVRRLRGSPLIILLRRGLRRRIEHQAGHLDSREPVDHRMMSLPHHAQAPVL
jgi:hypothetical protein